MRERGNSITLKERLKERYRVNGVQQESAPTPIQVELLSEPTQQPIDLQPGKPKDVIPPYTSLPAINTLLEESVNQSLNHNELQLYNMCQDGLSNNQIAVSLGINEITVKSKVYELRKKLENEILPGFRLQRVSSFNPQDQSRGTRSFTYAASRRSLESLPILRIKYTTSHEVKKYLNARRGDLSSVESLGVVASHRVLSPREHDIVRRNKEFEELVFQVNGIECFYESDLPQIRELISPHDRVPISELEPDTSMHSGIRGAIKRGRLKSEIVRGVHQINPEEYREYKDSIKGKKRDRKPKLQEEIF